MISRRLSRISLTSSLLLAGCNLAPPSVKPDTPVPVAFKESGDWQLAHPADDIPRGDWWTLYHDDGLSRLEARVADANQDLKAAMARLDQARAASAYARAAYFPVVNAKGSATRQRISATTANTRPIDQYSDLQLGANVSYELDLWGRIRNTVRASKERAAASAGDLVSLDLSIHAELATDYFNFRADEAKQNILDETVSAYDRALTLANQRHDGGAGSAADVAEAETQVQTAKTAAADIALQRAQLEHAIAILVGSIPADFTFANGTTDFTPPSVKVALPGTLLERRPDIAAAERRVEAANANIGVVRAAFYPVFSLSGFLGVESAAPAALFNAPSEVWQTGGSILGALFDGGQREAASDEAHAAYDETVADYRESVLQGYREVEDNLAALRQLDMERQTEDQAVAAAQRALDQAIYRYKGGITTYIEVITAQNAALQTRLSSTDIKARQVNATILLVKALGGGWSGSLDQVAAQE